MTIGPVEYLVLGFPGNHFNGDIAPALADLVQSGTVKILDLVFIAKDGEGDVIAVEFDEHEALAAFGSIDGEVGGLISPEDIEHAAEDLRAKLVGRAPRLGGHLGDPAGRGAASVRR